jgi:hypothetical protein
MVTRAQNFRHADVRRAFKAAAAAGIPDPVVRVVCKDGTELHIGSRSSKSATTSPAKRQRTSPRQPAR